jgi:phospholipid/cholesterol/gamma-HCH transport system substrate-binding protein
MTRKRALRLSLAVVLVAALVVAGLVVLRSTQAVTRNQVVAYFANSNGVFVGDDVRIRGVNVGRIDKIEPEPTRVKITFWYDDAYKVPADAKAVILSPTLVTARAIQLTPPYRGGPTLQDNSTIGEDRTAVPVEYDDFRAQLERLTATLQPTQPGGVSTLGALVNTTADNLRGQGANIRDSLTKLSQAISALGDHSSDTFTSVKNLSTLVSALQGSTDIIRQLNQNLASVSGLLANDPTEVANALKDFDDATERVRSFVADNRETIGVTADKAASVSTALNQSLDDIKQLLHVLPTTAANAVNLYQPAQGALTGAASVNNFSDPISFICGAIQAASRLGAEQSSKLCVQYLAPIVKNRQYNFPPIGANPFVGATARPNEITYSEDRLRPDFVPPASQGPAPGPAAAEPPLPAEAPTPLSAGPSTQPTDPALGLPGIMMPPGGP